MLPTPADRRPDRASPLDTILLSVLALLTPIALLAVVLHGLIGPWPAASHLALAVGIFPLILAAMIYFTKTLTRTGPVRWGVLLLPLLALAAGILVVLAMILEFRWIYPAGILGMVAAGGVLIWIEHRIRLGLGPPHPGIHWYRLALAFLLAGLAAILTGLTHLDWLVPLQTFHRYANLFGFVGLTAVGTLQVLWPTVQARPDPDTPRRCRVDLRFAGIGAALLALGAAWNPAIYLAGWLAWSLPPGRLLYQSWHHRRAIRRLSGIGWSLVSAMLGLILTPALGFLALFAWVDPRRLPTLFLVLILCPLVTGALSHLLPLWLLPGPRAAEQEQLRQILTRASHLRVILFLVSGVAFVFGPSQTILVATLGILLFVGQAGWATLRAIRLPSTLPWR